MLEQKICGCGGEVIDGDMTTTGGTKINSLTSYLNTSNYFWSN